MLHRNSEHHSRWLVWYNWVSVCSLGVCRWKWMSCGPAVGQKIKSMIRLRVAFDHLWSPGWNFWAGLACWTPYVIISRLPSCVPCMIWATKLISFWMYSISKFSSQAFLATSSHPWGCCSKRSLNGGKKPVKACGISQVAKRMLSRRKSHCSICFSIWLNRLATLSVSVSITMYFWISTRLKSRMS